MISWIKFTSWTYRNKFPGGKRLRLFPGNILEIQNRKMVIEGHIKRLESLFHQNHNPERAVSSARYMKNHFVYYGVDATRRREIQKIWMAELKKGPEPDRWELIREMWEKEHREIHYAAIDWLNSWKKQHIEKEDIVHVEWLLTNHSWWDSVDAIASNFLGTYFRKFPEQIEPVISDWRNSDNMWLNRSCLIFQLKYKKEVHFELLKSLIIQYQPVKEFFIQKAIGWALRQYSKFDPEAVRSFMDEIDLKGLARREGGKYV